MEITTEQFALIKPYLPRQRGNVQLPNIAVINAILWLAENDCKWSVLPRRFGKWHSVYARVNRWRKSGVLDRLFEHMQRLQIIRLRLEIAPPFGAGAASAKAVEPVNEARPDGPMPSIDLTSELPKFAWVPRIRVCHRRVQAARRHLRRARAAARAALWLATAGLALLALGGEAQAAGAPARGVQTPEPGMGEPVNIYAPGVDVYAPHVDGEIHPWHAKGQVWLLAGEPGESNVAVQVGDEGVLVVDTGTQALAPKLLAQIQRLAREHAGDQNAIRIVVNTNGRLDHIGGNAVIRAAGSQVIAGEEAAQQGALGTPGAEVIAEQNVLTRLAQSVGSGSGAYAARDLWPTDAEDFDIYNSYFNGEAVQLYHPHEANTDGQLVVLFRQSDVIAAGDVVDMRTYPIIDVSRGGTIDGELVALNQLMDLAVPAKQVEGGTVIVPGHGRLCDASDVAQYTIMVTIIRNRVQLYRNQGKSLQQVLALAPSGEYDQRWGGKGGAWTTRDFITAVYETLPAKGPVFFSMHTSTAVPRTGSRTGSQLF